MSQPDKAAVYNSEKNIHTIRVTVLAKSSFPSCSDSIIRDKKALVNKGLNSN